MKLFKNNYDESYFNTVVEANPFLKKDIEQKMQLIKSNKGHGHVLEIGCGDGALLKEIQANYNVRGVDISKYAITKASKIIDSKKLKVLDIEKEDIDGDFDIILAFDVMEHLKNPDEVIKKIKKSLRKNGVFIFSVPNNYGIFGKMMTKIFNFIDKTHVSTFQRQKWIHLLEDNNFNIEVVNHGLLGYQKKDFVKHFSFNLVIIAHLETSYLKR